LFKILSEESVAKGIRRITALTGRAAVAHMQQLDKIVREASAALRVVGEQLPERIAAMQNEIKQLRKRPSTGGAALQEFTPDSVLETPAGDVLIGQVGHADAGAMRTLCDVQRQKGAAALLVGGADGKKVTLVAMVCKEVVKEGKLRADDWVKAAAKVVGGSGGGKPTLAQGGGEQGGKLADALQAASDYAREKLR
jgi:alanyl-tRNA synthetase